MNSKIITQALYFKKEPPSYSKVKALCELALEYQEENSNYFLYAKRREKVVIIDEEEFFRFINETQNIDVKNFLELQKLKTTISRSENIRVSGDSKVRYLKVFDKVVLMKQKGHQATLYQKEDLAVLTQRVQNVVVVENAESFLNLQKYEEHFSEEYFVYLSGYANSLTREYLRDLHVEFFVDYDIEGMNIYESFECNSKSLHIAENLEEYFKKYKNIELYKKQRHRFKKYYTKEAQEVIYLIQKYSNVVEQEIIYEA